MSTLTVGEVVDRLAEALPGEGMPADRATARDLVAAVLDVPRFWPTAHAARALDEPALVAIAEAADRLSQGMPLQYAAGKAAFRSLTLAVDPRVLIPRPETELLVELVLGATRGEGTVADVGTGSGAIALALAAEGRYLRVIATDVSADALAVARSNLSAVPAERRASVEFREGSLLAPLRGESLTALVSNPPYIASTEAGELPALVRDWEPPLALFSGPDGNEACRALVAGAAEVVGPGGLLALEVDARRAQAVRAMAEATGAWRDVEVRLDLTGRERFVVARRRDS